MRIVLAEDLALLRDGRLRLLTAYQYEVVEAVDNGPSLLRALTNSAKHAAAQSSWVWVRHDGQSLTALVGDDGVGGAQLTPGGGLAGIESRLAAFDGTLSMASPLGGPTIVTLKVPCALTAGAVAN